MSATVTVGCTSAGTGIINRWLLRAAVKRSFRSRVRETAVKTHTDMTVSGPE